MPDARHKTRAIISVFDLRRADSREELVAVVGEDGVPPFEALGKPFVAMFTAGGPDGKIERLGFADDAEVILMYRAHLRVNIEQGRTEGLMHFRARFLDSALVDVLKGIAATLIL